MIIFTLTLEDLARTRFAISPMWELITSLRMLRDPDRAAMHVPWVREALPIARDLDLATALALTPSEGYMPDFLTPPPTSPVASFEDELDLLCATPPDQVRADIETLFGRRRLPEGVRAMRENPSRELAGLVDVLERYWKRALEPHWPRIRAVLDADLAHRARRLTDGGPEALLADLHDTVRLQGQTLEIDGACEIETLTLHGQGILLVPSAFQWQRPATIASEPWQPTVFYPARGVGLLWEPHDGPAPEALSGVLGATRAKLLTTLDAPRSTTQLAQMLELSPGGISQHLSALREAGLVSATRQNRSVLYCRTGIADGLISEGADEG